MTSVAVLLTTHSVMAILAVGDLVRDSGRRAGIGRFRRANLLDMTVCTYPFLLPFFIPTILAASATASGESFGIARVSALEAGSGQHIFMGTPRRDAGGDLDGNGEARS